jgi:putative ABC transport system permease protein
MQTWLPATKYADRVAVSSFYQEVLRRLQGFPEIRAAALVNTRPFLGWSLGARFEIPGQPLPAGRDAPIVGCRVISPAYLSALGTPLLKGRSLTEADGPSGAAVALVNEALAVRYWPNGDPIGQSIRVTSLGSTSGAPWWPEQMADVFTIVGVVGNVRENRLRDQVEPVVYLSYLQNSSRFMHVMVRTASTPGGVLNLVQREIRAVDPDLGVYDARTMDAVVDQILAEPKFNSLLLWIFAAAALVLSAVGVYGVTSSAVALRSREFAIRMALGAGRRSIFQLVTHDGLFVALIGIGTGLTGALFLARTLSGLLNGVVATDGMTLAGGALVVLTVALAASWRPACRATRVDPMSLLRAD